MPVLLIKFHASDAPRAKVLCAPSAVDLQMFRAMESDACYLYVTIAGGSGATALATIRGAIEHALRRASVTHLELVLELPGAWADRPAPYHYVVETDVLAEFEAEFNRWYDDEHLPGLASVPGTVRARRYRDPDGSPRYHACYDLVEPGTLGSPRWLAVRATPWSVRMRPAFRNTTRTLFRRLGP